MLLLHYDSANIKPKVPKQVLRCCPPPPPGTIRHTDRAFMPNSFPRRKGLGTHVKTCNWPPGRL